MSTQRQTGSLEVDRRGDDYRPATRLLHLATWVTNQAAMRAFQMSSSALEAESSHTRDYALLANLVELGPGSQIELSRRTGINGSDVVPALNDMEARGEVARAVDPADRRRNVVTATDHGRDRLAHLDAVLATVQDEYLAVLTASEQRRLLTLLRRVARLPQPDPS
jgi:MarR family transcriptional regulator, lower aerobic nicotinate degradation pathway regulator